MPVALLTGSAGLIGSPAAEHFAGLGLTVVGVDNDMRKVFFGDDSSTAWMAKALSEKLGDRYVHRSLDIRDRDAVDALFSEYGTDIELVIHAAAQPSHPAPSRAALNGPVASR